MCLIYPPVSSNMAWTSTAGPSVASFLGLPADIRSNRSAPALRSRNVLGPDRMDQPVLRWTIGDPAMPGQRPSGYGKIAIEHGHLEWIYPWKMVMFYSKMWLFTRGYMRKKGPWPLWMWLLMVQIPATVQTWFQWLQYLSWDAQGGIFATDTNGPSMFLARHVNVVDGSVVAVHIMIRRRKLDNINLYIIPSGYLT